MDFQRESSVFLGGSVDGSMSESSLVVRESFLAFSKKIKVLKAVRQHGPGAWAKRFDLYFWLNS